MTAGVDIMSKTPNYDSAVKKILDQLQPRERTCALTGETWIMTDEEIGWYRRFNVPPSKLSPRARLRLLLGFASGLALWWKPHAKTGSPILSFVHPDSPFQVIPDKEWMSEDFSRDESFLDSSQPFFPQMLKLAHSVPVGACRDDGSNKNCFGVDYINSENSYMVFSLCGAKNCFYPALALYSEDSVDVTNTKNSQQCYHTNRVNKMFRCAFSFECRDCLNSIFLFDCRNCEFCFGATNARNKKYLWFNEQLAEDEWKKRRAEVDLSCYSVLIEYQEKFNALVRDSVWPENFNVGSDDCRGEYIEDSTRCDNCYWLGKSTDLYWCWVSEEHRDCAFSAWTGWGGDSYYTCDVVGGGPLRFCFRCWRCVEMEYCMDCYDCEFCFGCVGLKKKRFHIFNKEYSKEEYWQKVDELKCAMLDRGEYGEYFPASFSENGFEYAMYDAFFGYSEKDLEQYQAPRFDPRRGAVVSASGNNDSQPIDINSIPDCLSQIDEATFVGKPILDPVLGRPFSVVAGEMAFYRSQGYSFPREHFLRRLKASIRTSNSPEEEKALCGSCGKAITTYKNSTFSKRKVFCKECYLKFLEQNN